MIENFALRPDANVMLNESISTNQPFYIPFGGVDGGNDGLIVTFGLGTNHEWTGIFAFGNNGNLKTTGIIPLPNNEKVLIVSNGDGFIVDEGTPGEFDRVPVIPVRSIHVIESHNIVVLADDTSLAAFGENGAIWETGRIAWNDLTVGNVAGDHLSCTTFDIRSDEYVNFTVDLTTGRCVGGVELI